MVLKPTIAGAARHTYKLNASNIVEHEEIFQNLIKKEDMMIQPYQYSITTKGDIDDGYCRRIYSRNIKKG